MVRVEEIHLYKEWSENWRRDICIYKEWSENLEEIFSVYTKSDQSRRDICIYKEWSEQKRYLDIYTREWSETRLNSLSRDRYSYVQRVIRAEEIFLSTKIDHSRDICM